MADFLATVKRTLTEDEHKLFRWHYLLGASWRMCCDRIAVDRGTFFYEVYKIEAKLGRAFRETLPYGLFPIDEYYGGIKVEHKGQVLTMQARPPVRPPVAQVSQEVEPDEEKKVA